MLQPASSASITVYLDKEPGLITLLKAHIFSGMTKYMTLNCKNFDFTGHAVEQMFARQISIDDVKEVVISGERIKSYPDDRPFPSHLLLYFINERPIHVVVSINSETNTCIIITAYEPSRDIWQEDFKKRK